MKHPDDFSNDDILDPAYRDLKFHQRSFFISMKFNYFIFWPIRTLNWLVAASKLQKHRHYVSDYRKLFPRFSVYTKFEMRFLACLIISKEIRSFLFYDLQCFHMQAFFLAAGKYWPLQRKCKEINFTRKLQGKIRILKELQGFFELSNFFDL